MTNETTASQPKSIGDDAPIYQRREQSGAWRDTTLLGLQAWEESGRATRIVYFRAPAAQASATIQAAPRVPTEEMQNAARDWAVKKYGIGIGKDAALGCWQAMWDAATIQEPVMFAEPVGADVCKSCEGSGEVTGFIGSGPDGWEETRSCPDCGGTGEPAAPMVADPAGVTPEMIQWRNIQKVVAAVADFCFGSKYDPVYGASHCAVTTCLTAKDGVQVTLEPLAATVKAVPSEALEDLMIRHRIGVTPENEGGFHAHIYQDIEEPVMVGYGATPREAVDSALTAQLAGKTGGGE